MISEFDENKLKLIREKADQGNMKAVQSLQKIERETKLNAAKEEMLGKAMFEKHDEMKDVVRENMIMPSSRNLTFNIDELDISEIENYITTGEFKSLPEHMTVYLRWMEIAHDWYYKFKSRTWVLRFLIANCKDRDGNNISFYFAEKIFNDMLAFFYPDRNLKKNHWFRYLAERIEMGAALALENNDFETYGKNLERAAKVMGMIEMEKSNIDARLLDRRPRFFITNAKELGIPEIDRYALARHIDEMAISEKEKLMAKRDLGVEERNLES